MLTIFGIAFSIYLLYNSTNIYLYLIAIVFLLLSSISGFFNIFSSYSYYRSNFYAKKIDAIRKSLKPLDYTPKVAVVVPVYNEDPMMVKNNFLKLLKMDYEKGNLSYYLLDDSDKKYINDFLRNFCASAGIRYIHRKTRKGYKAGALNNMLKVSDEEFIAIFDGDEKLIDRGFVKEMLPYFNDKSIAYIQTEKRYSKGSFFSDTVNLFDAFFFKFIQPSRALNNTAIFAGSCGMIRRSAIDKVGGFPEYVTEDTFFSFESDKKEFKSLYVPKVYALGKPIMKFSDLVKQQWRYNYGDTQFLLYFLKNRQGKDNKKMGALSKVDYFTHGFGLNYISVILIFFTVVSILIVFSSLQFASMSAKQLIEARYLGNYIEIVGFGVFALSLITPVILTKVYFKSVKKGFMVLFLNFSLAFVRANAALSAITNFRRKNAWSGDYSKSSRRLPLAFRNSFTEVVFSAALFGLGGIALMLNNLSGGLWLIWYGFLYTSTFYFFYKYG